MEGSSLELTDDKFSSSVFSQRSNNFLKESSAFTTMTGYTGYRSKSLQEDYSRCSSPAKFPILGYTGMYRGKKLGAVLGRVNLHRKSLAEWDNSEEDRRIADINSHAKLPPDERFNGSILQRYESSMEEARGHGHSISRIMSEIKHKFEVKYRTIAERRTRVKSIFNEFDVDNSGTCSGEIFHVALQQVGIQLPRCEFESLCSSLDEFSSGDISYMKFLDIVCPMYQQKGAKR